MSRFTGFSEKSFFKKKSEIWPKQLWAVMLWLYFLKELDSTDCSMLVLERLDFQRRDVINSNSWFLAILPLGLPLFKPFFCVYMHDSRAGFKILYAQQFFPVYCHVLFRVCTACMIPLTVTYHNYLSLSLQM